MWSWSQLICAEKAPSWGIGYVELREIPIVVVIVVIAMVAF